MRALTDAIIAVLIDENIPGASEDLKNSLNEKLELMKFVKGIVESLKPVDVSRFENDVSVALNQLKSKIHSKHINLLYDEGKIERTKM